MDGSLLLRKREFVLIELRCIVMKTLTITSQNPLHPASNTRSLRQLFVSVSEYIILAALHP